MTPNATTLAQSIRTHQADLIDDWLARLGTDDADEAAALRAEMPALLRALADVFEHAGGTRAAPALQSLDAALAASSEERAMRGLPPEGSVRFLQCARDALLALVQRHRGDLGDAETAHQQVQSVLDRCVTTLVSQFVATRESVIRAQAQSLLDMSTPVITLWDSILLLPLVGVVDSVRAVQVAERLLEAIGRTEAVVTLIDVTGVPVMDTSVARHLLRTVAAAELLGTRVILTGISPTTAQTIVKLGIDMSSVPTRGSLKAGVALALQLTGRGVQALDAGA